MSNEFLMSEGGTYRFKLVDLPKYSSKLHVKDLDEKFKVSALGRRILSIKER